MVAMAMLAIAFAAGATTPVPGEVIEIPLDMVGGRPQVDVYIGGVGPYPFVLDTGASLNVLDSGIARVLGLEVVGEQAIGAPGMEQVPAEVVRVPELAIHRMRLADEELVTMDLAGLSGGLFLGVLRFGAFADSLATLDLAGKTLRLSRGSLDADALDVISFDAVDGLIDIPVSIAGHEFRAHVDSGSPGRFAIPAKLAEDLEFLEGPSPMGEVRLMGGQGTVSHGKVDGDLTVGQLRFADPEVSILDVPVPKVNVGSLFLADHLVQIDQRRGLIRFETVPIRRVTAARPAPSTGGRRLGLRPRPGPPGPNGLALFEGGLAVESVDPGSLASEAGLRSGDVILAVNGTPLSDFDRGSLAALFAGSDALRMEVRRADSSAVDLAEIP